MTISFKKVSWQDLNLNLVQGADIVISGLTISTHRLSLGSFSNPYILNSSVIVGTKDSASIEDFKEFALKNPSLKFGVNQGGFLEKSFRHLYPFLQLVPVNHNLDLPTRLLRKEYDFFISDQLEAETFIKKFPLRIFVKIHPQYQGVIVTPHSKISLNKLNGILNKIEQAGTLKKLRENYKILDQPEKITELKKTHE